MRVTQDSLSWAISILGILLPALLLTYAYVDFATFGVLMVVWGFGIAGIALMASSKVSLTDDPSFGQKDVEKVSRFTLISFLAMLSGSLIVPNLFTSIIPLSITTQTRLLYSWFFAVNEETFFRGGFLFQVYSRYPNKIVAAGMSAVVFAIYHLAVYGTQPDALLFVLLAGAALSYAVLWSGRMTPAYLSHFLWNTFAIVGTM